MLHKPSKNFNHMFHKSLIKIFEHLLIKHDLGCQIDIPNNYGAHIICYYTDDGFTIEYMFNNFFYSLDVNVSFMYWKVRSYYFYQLIGNNNYDNKIMFRLSRSIYNYQKYE